MLFALYSKEECDGQGVWQVWGSGEKRVVVNGMGGEPEGKRTLGRHMLYDRIILKWIFKKDGGGVNWNGVSQDRDRWRPLVNAEKSSRFP